MPTFPFTPIRVLTTICLLLALGLGGCAGYEGSFVQATSNENGPQ